ncbi:MAG TPA: H/ACA RNA-protein complex protein Gar1 [Methanosarcinaceae archaeon]|nr:H/ACA RNA-protein complex protein Gar1 [Methanosarcinaceae archaeon]
MKRLGTVLHISSIPLGLVVRGDKLDLSGSKRSTKKVPGLNSAVLNKNVKQIGKISGIIGPVEHPYIYVKISNDIDPEQHIHANERVYVL